MKTRYFTIDGDRIRREDLINEVLNASNLLKKDETIKNVSFQERESISDGIVLDIYVLINEKKDLIRKSIVEDAEVLK